MSFRIKEQVAPEGFVLITISYERPSMMDAHPARKTKLRKAGLKTVFIGFLLKKQKTVCYAETRQPEGAYQKAHTRATYKNMSDKKRSCIGQGAHLLDKDIDLFYFYPAPCS